MRKHWLELTMVLLTCCLLAACGKEKGLAEAAIKTAEDAVNAAGADVGQYAADQWKSVTDQLAAAKDAFAKRDYKAALAGANEVSQKVQDAVVAASAKKDELTKAWNEMSAGLPKMVDAIKSRVDILSASKKLPKGLDKAKLEEAKAALASATQSWKEASEAFKAGSLQDAVAKANSVKEKATEVMKSLGMTPPEAAAGGGAAPPK
jgi:hypothetical protein